MDTGVAIRTMTPEDLALAVGWAAEEGWNPGRPDAAAFLAADSAGFLIGEIGGRPVGCISATATGDAFGFIGFYIVRPGWRGRGHGMALWQAGMARLAGRLVGLDGVVAQQANYRRSGFLPAWRNLRYQAARVAPGRPEAPGLSLVPAADLPFAALAALDRHGFPVPREAFLRAWLALPGQVALAALRGGVPVGFGAVRPAHQGWRIGPLVADAPDAAEALFAALAAAAGEGPLALDVPEPNAAARRLAERAGMAPAFEVARMYTGPAPAMELGRLYGVTSFELG